VTVSAAALRLDADAQLLDTVFGALADPTRRSILIRLLQHGPTTATQLTDGSPLTRQAIVKHLQALAEASLVDAERVGREVRYRATPQHMASAIGWMLDAGASWDRRIDRLRGAAGDQSANRSASEGSAGKGATGSR
jgi:DNA-binding transcriptional ArsR family regulator